MTEGFAGLPYDKQAYTATTGPVSKAMQELLRRHAREVAELSEREKAARLSGAREEEQ